MSLLSAGCLLWLERLQPLFLAVAIVSLAYQVWIVRKRTPAQRTWTVKAILAASMSVNLAVISLWVVLWVRYR